jgi:hypothetical protein
MHLDWLAVGDFITLRVALGVWACVITECAVLSW